LTTASSIILIVAALSFLTGSTHFGQQRRTSFPSLTISTGSSPIGLPLIGHLVSG